MIAHIKSSIPIDERDGLVERLYEVQQGRCFICENQIDLVLHKGKLDVDHVQPRSGPNGKDDPTNYALTHDSCNRSKLASDLRVARVLARFERIGSDARHQGRDAPHLGDVLAAYQGARYDLPINRLTDGRVRYSFKHLPDEEGTRVREAEVYTDELAKMSYFFARLPIEYLHHDSKINPRASGEACGV